MSDETTDEDRATARGIFATARRTGLFSHPAPEEAEPTEPGNHVPREGDVPGPPSGHDDPRDLVRALFSN